MQGRAAKHLPNLASRRGESCISCNSPTDSLMQTVHALFQEFSHDPERGLSAAQVEASRRKYGANVLTPLPREPIWKKFLEKFDEPIIRILLAAALLSMVVDLFRADAILASFSLVGMAVALIGAMIF